jgi:hypothetical protein
VAPKQLGLLIFILGRVVVLTDVVVPVPILVVIFFILKGIGPENQSPKSSAAQEDVLETAGIGEGQGANVVGVFLDGLGADVVGGLDMFPEDGLEGMAPSL